MSQATLPDSPYLNSNLFSGYYLDERVYALDEWDCDDEAAEALQKITELWGEERALVESYKEDPLLDSWIDPVLEILGFDTISEQTLPAGGGFVDRLLYDSPDARRAAAERKLHDDDAGMFNRACALLEAKQWNADFTAHFSEQRSYRDASHQVKYYLERTPGEVTWGILTNGRKWRLYGTKDYETQTYYEVDLPELIESGSVERFKYFFVFFRPEAFLGSPGTTFLDTVWSESETAAQELGEDLQDNVFTALRVLGEGFVEGNDLDIDPDDEEALTELKEQSLVLLYRLMFILYAEARDLINPSDPHAQHEYDENFSLDEIRVEIYETIDAGHSIDEEYSTYSTTLWQRLQDLFGLIDSGNDDLGIPPYNGGLFDDDAHEFLADHSISNRYLAAVIYRLSTTKNGDGEDVLADYADLDTRHLGSIYEGLLEHEFRIAGSDMAAVAEDGGQVWKDAGEVTVADAVETVDRGELYVVNDDGERKATGAYYTPDYVVTYIVEETIDPLIDEIRDDLTSRGLEPGDNEYVVAFYRRVRELKVLDPAMGSGHFLTRATGYLAEQVMEEVRELETATLYNEEHVRREIAKECIYGVDINGMSVELAKLSMWLETLAADQPLAFLDHHLKAGNSLVGSDIEEVLTNGDEGGDDGQLTLTQSFQRTRQQALEHVMDLLQDLLSIDNQTLSDVKAMEETYAEIREDPLFQHLVEMANVHTAERFGLDVPSDASERMAAALRDGDWTEIEGQDWFRSAQAMADEEAFFHWRLEFPGAFYDDDGELKEESGFDAVIGNPPWVDVKGLERPEVLFDLFKSSFNRVNIYSAFFERSAALISTSGRFGFITPNSYMTQSSYKRLRKVLLEQFELKSIVRLPDDVFSEVTMETAVFIAKSQKMQAPHGYTFQSIIYPRDATVSTIPDATAERKLIDISSWIQDDLIFDIFTSAEERAVIERIEESKQTIEDLFETCLGITPYDKHQGHTQEQIENRAFHADKQKNDDYYKLTSGAGIKRYHLSWEGGEWIKYGDWLGAEREKRFFTEPRCVVRQIVSSGGPYGIHAAFTDKTMFHTQVGFVLLPSDGDILKAKNIVGILNSKLITFYHRKKYLDENKDTFQKILIQDTKRFPLPSGFTNERLTNHIDTIEETREKSLKINLDLLDYLGNYAEGPEFGDIGLFQPASSVRDSILNANGSNYDDFGIRDKLGITAVKLRRTGDDITVFLKVRYKPTDTDGLSLDSNGYWYSDYKEAFTLTDLTENEAALIEAFVPVAVDEAGGFANFRKNATKTNSPIDRLKALTLPDPDDVADDLDRYLEAKARADDLDAKIEKTDALIDEIVYHLYGLTDEEIELVEASVAD
ncbi:MAG: Eco57I restriction-modification methylase domain-containing protein [Salinigranum sp.]